MYKFLTDPETIKRDKLLVATVLLNARLKLIEAAGAPTPNNTALPVNNVSGAPK